MPAGAPPDTLGAARGGLARALLALVPEPDAGLAVAMLLGDRSGLPRALVDDFAVTGTAHLLAISGFNMTLAAGAVAAFLKPLVPGPLVAAGALVSVGGYAMLVGPQPSVLRAATMASVAAIALGMGRSPFSANALAGAVAAMVALDPAVLRELSFQLSVSATAGLLAFQQPLARRFSGLPSIVGEGLATTLAASALTVPLVAAAFGRLSLVAPLANLLAVPVFAPLLLASAATSAVGALSVDAARPLALATWLLSATLRAVVTAAAQVPAASFDLPRGAAGAAAGALAVAAAGVALVRGPSWSGPLLSLAARRVRAPAVLARLPRLRPRVRRGHAAALASVLLLAAGVATLTARAPDVRIRALDVGQGDAFLVEVDDRALLIDGGPQPKRLLAELGSAFPPWRRRIDVVALTHAHLDHAAGLLELFDRYEVGLALEPRGIEAGPLTSRWRERLARAGVAAHAVGAGDRVRLGSATVEVLAPSEDRRSDLRNLVLRVVRGSFSALFTGDATDLALADLLLEPSRLAASVYVPPHHGAATEHAGALVAAVRPRVAVLSVGASNRYGHPAPATLAALDGIPTYRTDRDGTVEVALDGSKLSIRARTAAVPADRGRPVPRSPPAG